MAQVQSSLVVDIHLAERQSLRVTIYQYPKVDGERTKEQRTAILSGHLSPYVSEST